MKKLTRKTWLAIVIFALFGQVAWTIENMVLNQFIANELGASQFDIALMVSLSAIVATLTTLFLGALSDKLGKRKIFISIGYLIWGITIICFSLIKKENLESWFGIVNGASLGIGLVIAFDCIMSFFGSTANDAAFNCWVTEITDDGSRGKAEGVMSAMPLLSVLVVYGMLLFMDYYWLFAILGIIVLIVGVLGFFIVDESEVKPNPEGNYFKNIFYGFRPSVIKQNSILYIIFITFGIFCISNQVFMPYYVIYLEQQIGESYVFVMAPAIIVAAIFTIIFGRILDKYKLKISVIPALALYFVGLLLLFLLKGTAWIFVGCTIMLMGFLSLTACYQASIREYVPKDNVGLFQGIRMFIQVLFPMIIGPWIGALMCGQNAGIGGVVDSQFSPSSNIYLGGILVGLLHLIPLFFVIRKINKTKIENTEATEE